MDEDVSLVTRYAPSRRRVASARIAGATVRRRVIDVSTSIWRQVNGVIVEVISVFPC